MIMMTNTSDLPQISSMEEGYYSSWPLSWINVLISPFKRAKHHSDDLNQGTAFMTDFI